MIAGLCAVALGAIALWQAVVAAVLRRVAADAFADGHRTASESWRTVLEVHEAAHRALAARHNTFVAGVKRCHDPDVRASARAMHQAIHDAAVAANLAAETARTAAPGTAGP